MKRASVPAGLLLLSALACAGPDGEAADIATAAAAADASLPASGATPGPLPTILVYKTASCGCCRGWVEHLRAEGFTVDARDVVDLASIKQDAGVSAANASCHTALVDGYVVEGHVPADQIKRLLAERPEIAGLAVPGMPVGSPGMEGPGGKPHQVIAFDRRGANTVYATVAPR